MTRMRDQELAERVLAGDTDAWHDLVERYAGLIHSVAGRYFHDRDEVSTVFVRVLERIHGGLLAQYEGRARLSTWLAVVARSTALDHLRHVKGRRITPPGVLALDGFHQRVFAAYYDDGLSIEAIRHQETRENRAPTEGEILAALNTIIDSIGQTKRRRLEFERQARRDGLGPGRLIEYLEHRRRQHEQAAAAQNPDALLLEQETRKTLRRIDELRATLPHEERRALTLRFDEERSAAEIAEALELPDRRQAYTLVNRALRRLRRLIEGQ